MGWLQRHIYFVTIGNCNRKRNDEDKHENKTLPLAFQPNQSERTVLADEGIGLFN